MADQAELIRQQMDETRTAMTEKIEALEKQVSETVKDTATTVAETVNVASETVDKTVNTIADTVQTVTDTFNISAHISNYPWVAVRGSVVVGFLLGSMFMGGRRHPTYVAPPAPPTPAPQPAPQYVAESPPTEASEPQQPSGLASVLGSLKSLAVGTAVGALGNTILSAVPTDLRSSLSGIIQDVAERLGGDPTAFASLVEASSDKTT